MTTSQDLLRLHDRNTGHAGINSLFSKAHSMDWDLDRDVDWDVEIRDDDPIIDPSWTAFGRTATFRALPPELQRGLSRLELCRTLNLLQVGESVAQDVCAKLALLCDEEDYRNHAVAQAMDEARHHAAYVRFLQKLHFEDWDDLDPILVGTFDRLLEVEDVTELVVTEQFLLESLAMPLFERMAEQAVNPLFRDIVTLIKRDESRHMGFGVLYVTEHLKSLSPDDRLQFAAHWLPRILSSLRGGPGPKVAARTEKRLAKLGASDPQGLAQSMLDEQLAVNAADREDASSGRRVPQVMASCRRAGLLEPTLLAELDLTDHPLVQGALAGRLPD